MDCFSVYIMSSRSNTPPFSVVSLLPLSFPPRLFSRLGDGIRVRLRCLRHLKVNVLGPTEPKRERTSVYVGLTTSSLMRTFGWSLSFSVPLVTLLEPRSGQRRSTENRLRKLKTWSQKRKKVSQRFILLPIFSGHIWFHVSWRGIREYWFVLSSFLYHYLLVCLQKSFRNYKVQG